MDQDASSSMTTGNEFASDDGSPQGQVPQELASGCSEDDDFPALVYARYFGLTRDYLEEDAMKTSCLPSPPASDLEELDDSTSMQGAGRRAADLVAAVPETCEKWAVDRDSAGYLASVLSTFKDSPSQSQCHDSDVTGLRDLKITEPLLSSDPELDVMKVRRRNSVNLSATGMQPFALDEDSGEGLHWSAEDIRLPSEIDRVVAREKLEVDGDTTKYLQGLLMISRLAADEDDEDGLGGFLLRRKRNVTPPLMPLSPEYSPPGVSASVEKMELTSSPDDLTAQEAADLARQLLSHDVALSQPPSMDAELSSSSGTRAGNRDGLTHRTGSSSSPIRLKRFQDLEADVPLIARDMAQPPLKRVKTVSVPEEILAIIPEPSSEQPDVNLEGPEHDMDALISDVITPLAESVIERAEKEQLVEFDTTMHVPVPVVDDHGAVAPRTCASPHNTDGSLLPNQKRLLARFKAELAPEEAKWRGLSKIERGLHWSPFPAKLGKVELDENLEDVPIAEYFADISFNGVREELDLREPARLKVLGSQHDEDDDELLAIGPRAEKATRNDPRFDDDLFSRPAEATVERGERPAPVASTKAAYHRPDMATMLRRRRLELEVARASVTQQLQRSRHSNPSDRPMNMPNENIGPSTACGELSNPSSLAAFLRLQGVPAGSSTACSSQGAPMNLRPPVEMPGIQNQEAPPSTVLSVAVLAPEVLMAGTPRWIVVSPDVMAKKQMMRHLQEALPSMEIIERGWFPLDNSVIIGEPTGKVVDPEPDITMSPGSGLIFTNLQKLKQKPLPGHFSLFGIRQRISDVALRLEKLLILVSAGVLPGQESHQSLGALDVGDTEALRNLNIFAESLDTEVEIQFVAGGESELSNRAASVISHHAAPDEKLLHDETLWERFLRQAGLTAYAAQAILSRLKQPDGSQETGGSSDPQLSTGNDFGLAAFVRMSAEERVKRFAPVMGGQRVLGRVSEVLDGVWPSAAKQSQWQSRR